MTMTATAPLSVESPARAARALMLAHELTTILRRFHARGIQVVPLRGPALSEQLYGDPLARPCGDLDVLVRKPELAQVKTELLEFGYRLCDRRPGFAQAFSYTFEFFKTHPIPVIVEPHWSLAYPPFVERLDMEPIWRRCVPGRACGVETLLLSPGDQILNLCLHLVHHHDSAPALWVSELDRFIRKYQATLDWPQLVSTAQQGGVGGLVAAALQRTRTVCDTPLPNELIGQLTIPRRIRPSLASAVIDSVSVPGKESLAAWFAVRGWRAKWRYAVGLLFPSPEFMRLHYGLSTRWQVAYWSLKRPLQLCREAFQGLFQLLSGSLRRRSSSAA
ncbi:MAG: nucleotidyltransferase family protein [Candidatus Omnitrophica bacterium]|nr:nucleotidyltransferase family protein [Candidatus Omnitrophota bacterium]